jgi:hypothetical protein
MQGYMARRFLFLTMLIASISMVVLGCKVDEEGNPVADDGSEVGEERRVIEWQGLIDHAGEDINFYVAHGGSTEPPGRVRQAKVDDHGQARWSRYIREITETNGVVYYYVDANEDGGCTTLYWEPSGLTVFPDAEEKFTILWGIEGNDRDMTCEGFKKQ